MHPRATFDETETAGREPFAEGARITRGLSLTIADDERLRIHVGFRPRAGGIWNRC